MGDWLETNAVALIGLLATIGLLVVTFWYAKTTKDMALTAKNAAAESARATSAAERSAAAALDAARVAQAQIHPNFEGQFVAVALADDGDHVPCLRIESTGDAVVIQRVKVRRGFRESALGQLNSTVALRDAELSPYGPDTALPMRLHHGEHMLLTHPSLQDDGLDPFYRLIIDVDYTFTEEGGVGATKMLVIDQR